ncbi:MAG: poly-gamma-glutamate biosynthesis protein PgsC [Candidatus Accumulibacter sp.]|jgi:poly-gamma-glutamate biosynthesis protein PgsC/CapC|nr:poly-gamma-glutamate biosynthesis protein PgsC [Accumulibacter sp.]
MLLAQSIALGLLFGFIVFELTGVVAGGLITPGYFALYFDRPLLIAQALAVAMATMLVVRLLGLVMILYGRRRFILAVLVSFSLQWLSAGIIWGFHLAQTRVDALGFIIPGIIAHEMERQGVGKTLSALFIVSVAVRLVLRAFGLIH